MSNDNFVNLSGRHRALLRSAQFCETSAGDEQIALGFELLDPGDGTPNGTFLTYFGVFHGGALDFTIDAIRNCGWNGDDLYEVPMLADGGQLNAEVSLVVAAEQYKEKWSNKVKWVNRPGGGKIKLERPLDDGKLKSFAQRMKSAVRAAGRDNGTRQTASSPGRPAASDDRQRSGGGPTHPNAPGGDQDEIPFASCSVADEPSSVAPVLRRNI